MSTVCAACQGDNPSCLVCGGSGFDRPAPERLQESAAVGELAVDRVKDLLDDTERVMQTKVHVTATRVRHRLRVIVAYTFVGMLGVSVSAFLLSQIGNVGLRAWLTQLLAVAIGGFGALWIARDARIEGLFDIRVDPDDLEPANRKFAEDYGFVSGPRVR